MPPTTTGGEVGVISVMTLTAADPLQEPESAVEAVQDHLDGLTESKDTSTRDGLSFLPWFLHTTGHEQSSSEILLVLQVQRVSETQ